MAHFQSFGDFLNEWNISKHWSSERASKVSQLSRIVKKNDYYKDGWTCENLIEVLEDGTSVDKKIHIKNFLDVSGLKMEDFEYKITETLYNFLNGDLVKNKTFMDSEEIHRYVYLCKLSFKVKNKYYSPIFTTKYGSGNMIWGDVKGNSGMTILYLPENYSVDQIKEKAERHRVRGMENFTAEDYLRKFKIDFLIRKNFPVIIEDSDKWEAKVKDQSNQRPYNLSTIKVDKDSDSKSIKWSMLMKPDSQVTVDVGTKLHMGNGKIREINKIYGPVSSKLELSIYNPDTQSNSLKTFIPGNTIEVVYASESTSMEERTIGDLPREGYLVKRIVIDRFSKDPKSKRNRVSGTIRNIFVVLPSGEIVYSNIK